MLQTPLRGRQMGRVIICKHEQSPRKSKAGVNLVKPLLALRNEAPKRIHYNIIIIGASD
jgi:hypothetical protein